MFSADRYERVAHALGKAYRDVVRGFRGRVRRTRRTWSPIRETSRRVEAVLELVRRGEGAAAIPFGGGTSVVGGVEPRLGRATPAWSRSTCGGWTGCSRSTPISLAARIQAGATGPRLEEQLREHGLTLRHFPQSFEYSTLGGWIATRAGGHFATLYTHIDDLVESVRAITPRATGRAGGCRARAPGPARTGC